MKRSSPLLLAGVAAGLLFAAGAVRAQPAPAAPPVRSFWSTLQPYGDLRLRYELDYDSVLADGVTPRADRSRLRSRTRLGLKGTLTDGLSFDARAHLGDRDNQQSPHVTLFQNGGDKGTRDEIVFNRILLKWQDGPLAVTLGRQDFPFWKPHEFLWDDDVYLDGVAASFKRTSGPATLTAQGGAWQLPDGPRRHDLADRSTLAAAQLVATRDLGPRGKFTAAGGLLVISDKSSVANPTNDDLDYTIGVLDLQHQFKLSGVAAALGASFYHNFKDGPAGDPRRGATDGWAVFAKLGRFDQPGDLQFAYYYADIEKYAVARFFAQDDWFRFGSASQTRASDYRGHELRFSYLWSQSVNLVARAYFVDTISTRERGDRARLDVNYRF